MRARTFNELIEDSAYTFGAQHEMKSRKINLTKAKLNMLAFKDIFRVGEEEMRKVSRLRRQKRKERKLNIQKSIYEQVSNDNDRPPHYTGVLQTCEKAIEQTTYKYVITFLI